MLLLLAILVAWLAIVSMMVALCKAAARGDAARARAHTLRTGVEGRRVAPGLVVWDPACVGARTRRATHVGRGLRRRTAAG